MNILKDACTSISTLFSLVNRTIAAVEPLVGAVEDCTKTAKAYSGEMLSSAEFDTKKASYTREKAQEAYEAEMTKLLEAN